MLIVSNPGNSKMVLTVFSYSYMKPSYTMPYEDVSLAKEFVNPRIEIS